MKHSNKRLLARLLALAVVPIAAVAGQQSAQADPIPPTQWPVVTLGDMPSVRNFASHLDGGITLACTSLAATTVLKTFNASGTVVQSTPAANTPRPNGCERQMAVGADGTVFSYAYGQNNYGFIQAYKNNSPVWQYRLPCGSSARPASMVVAPNGNLYMHIRNGSNCNSKLIGVTQAALPGTTMPTELVNVAVPWDVVFGGLAVHDTGLALFLPAAIQYRSFTGEITATYQHGWNGLPYLPFREHFDASLSGRAFVMNKANGSVSMCEQPGYIAGSLTAFEPSGNAWSITLPGCHEVLDLRPTPNGGVVMQSRWQREAGFPRYNRITGYSTQGVELWQTLSEIRPETPSSLRIAVDLNGNVATRTFTRVRRVINGTQYWFGEIYLSLLNGTNGQVLPGTVLTLRGDTTTPNGPSYKLAAADFTDIDVSIGKDVAFVPAQTCTSLSSCEAETKLYAFTVPGLEIDYPRGAILRFNQPWKRYVAMGDSFSSGQGVKPYQTGTDVAGPPENRCRRSEQGAYSKLLHGNLAARLSLTAFVACGGAETYHVINGRYGEGSQLDALSADTDIVTITIGGNDIGFGPLVEACVAAFDCTQSAAYINAVAHLQNVLPGALDNLFARIATKIGPQTRVLVVGYPLLIPEASAPTHWPYCEYLEPNEKTAARQIINDLDQALQEAADRAGHQFEYVDVNYLQSPFRGHELCNEGSYFYGLIGTEDEWFHPNAAGQETYYQIIARYL
ncbi:MAG TPA: SGNH/GDSL hydrolase family protein [Candidatus Saccharimonadales bacterium]|nr:SGNH/GDSL hydrolase family protein [Candidatus Saccharimonadales bacterium]